MRRHVSDSPRETERLGFAFARRLKRKKLGATVVALKGFLGAGKTTFMRGVFRAFGVRGRVTSPTFVLVKRRAIPSPRRHGFSFIYHVDLYRVRGVRAAHALGLPEILKNPRNVIFIEWAERAPRLLPPHALRVSFAHGAHAKERRITT